MSNIKKTREIDGIEYTVGEDYKHPKRGYCYVYKDNNYYPYLGMYKEGRSKREGLYKKEGRVILHKKKRTVKKIDNNELVADIIKNKTTLKQNLKESKKILTEEELKNFFAPEIRESNNLLIRIIKTQLKEKRIPEKELQSRFETMSQWNNFKRALILRDTITIECFDYWMKVLNLNWEIKVEDA